MKMLIAGVTALLLGASPAFADLRLTMHDGRVSIVAKDATVRQILTEWARVGHTRIVNVERIPGGPVTLELDNVTEMQALEVLLRPLSGYIAAPRSVAAENVSAYDRIIIMPTLADARPAPPVSSSPSSAAFISPPVFQQAAPVTQPAPVMQPADDDVINDPPPGSAQGVAPGSATSAAAMSAQSVAAASAQNVAAGSPETGDSPNIHPRGLEVGRRPEGVRLPSRPPVSGAPPVPTGVAVPGMIAPAPPQRGQPGQPGQPPVAPGQPARRPGGR
jgi:hypothetical protein